ncbi:MAG: hypothetical protein H0X15_01250 [Acidobacteria bacterium]|nr:hypothetical protein [Acidobacteriota bacterium]MBA4125071.1 hypothetical protein [Acidobacteriota bacterium]
MSKLSFSITANQATFVSRQFNGREGETATFLSRCPSNFSGLGGGFAPRQFNRYRAE